MKVAATINSQNSINGELYLIKHSLLCSLAAFMDMLFSIYDWRRSEIPVCYLASASLEASFIPLINIPVRTSNLTRLHRYCIRSLFFVSARLPRFNSRISAACCSRICSYLVLPLQYFRRRWCHFKGIGAAGLGDLSVTVSEDTLLSALALGDTS